MRPGRAWKIKEEPAPAAASPQTAGVVAEHVRLPLRRRPDAGCYVVELIFGYSYMNGGVRAWPERLIPFLVTSAAIEYPAEAEAEASYVAPGI